MSSDLAVRVDGVSKLYRIGPSDLTRSFRESLLDLMRLRRPFQGETRELWALRDVSFEVRRGEAIGIIGQNGAGKSTLLRILSRITEPTAGRVEIRDRVSSLLEVGTGFHPELTGRENIQLNGAILGMTRHEIRKRFDEIVAFAELEEFIDMQVKFYSSGMYMRLAFSVAAHLEPEILVADEVLAVGDAAFQAKSLRKMSDVAVEGRTVLFVSHNMPAVKTLCRTAVWLKQGRVVEIGPSAEVVDHYLQQSGSLSEPDQLAVQIDSIPFDPAFRMHSFRVLQNGEPTTNVLNGDPAEVEITFDLLEPTQEFQLYFQLQTLDEVVLFESILGGDAPVSPSLKAGRWRAVARIPANLLAPRPYRLKLGAAIGERHLIPEWVQTSFDVQQSGRFNQAFPGYDTPGKLAPIIPWNISPR